MRKKLLEIINEVLQNKKIKKINSATNLRTDIGMDSLDLARLTVLIEDKYGVDIFENGLIETVKDIEDKLNE